MSFGSNETIDVESLNPFQGFFLPGLGLFQ